VVSWPDLKWIREAWNGPVVVKGVLTAEDARRAVDEGVEAVVASNHGGRQLDGVAAEATKAEDFAAAEHFKKITEAYTVLSDPEKRALSTTATASRGARRKRRAARRHVRAPGRYRRVSRAASADAKMTLGAHRAPSRRLCRWHRAYRSGRDRGRAHWPARRGRGFRRNPAQPTARQLPPRKAEHRLLHRGSHDDDLVQVPRTGPFEEERLTPRPRPNVLLEARMALGSTKTASFWSRWGSSDPSATYTAGTLCA